MIVASSEKSGYKQQPILLHVKQSRHGHVCLYLICNGNTTEWSPIRSVIIQVITKSDDRAAGVRFVYHEYYHRRIGPHDVLLSINHKNNNFREKKNGQVMKERENLH